MRILLSTLFFFTCSFAYSQNTYLVFLSDKANSPYSVDKPEAFLSKKAIERRKKYHIAIQENDIPVRANYLDQLAKLPLEIHHKSKWLNAVGVICKPEVKKQIYALPFVRNIMPLKNSMHTKAKKKNIWKREMELNKYSSPNVYGETKIQNQLIRIDKLHKKGFTGKNMSIAILDAGFFKVDKLEVFGQIRKSNRIKDKFDFVDSDTLLYNEGYHGMEVMSTIGGEIDQLFIGSAPDANFYLYRTEDGSSESKLEELNWVAAAERADSVGVDLLNSSLGYHSFDDEFTSYTHDDLDGQTSIASRAAEVAASKGVLVVISAGNSGNDVWEKITPPADAKNIISVGATSPDGSLVGFSSVGPTSDGRIKPDITAMGSSVAVQAPEGGIAKSSGTSFAAPTVCGSAACLWQAFPNENNLSIMHAMRIGGNNYFTPEYDLGYGLANFEKSYNYLLTKTELSNSDLAIFPKYLASKSHVIVKNNDQNNFEAEVKNVLEKKQSGISYSQEKDIKTIERSNLPAGVYHISLQNSTSVRNGYFVVLP